MPPRMRTAEEAVNELKALDPRTAVTVTYTRRLIKEGKIPHVDVGRKKLINLDLLFEYLNGTTAEADRQPEIRGIRRIPE